MKKTKWLWLIAVIGLTSAGCSGGTSSTCSHTFGEWVTTIAQTADEDGEETRTCAKCGYAEKRVISAGTGMIIDLSESGTHVFTAADYGYGAITPLTVTVSNTGDTATGALSIALSGEGASAFALSSASINGIAAGGSANFTLGPKTGLLDGVYTETVTVSGAGVAARSFDVTFTVNRPLESLTIDFDQLQDHAPALSPLSLKLVGELTETSGAITVTNAGSYSAIQWLYNGAAITTEHPVKGAVIIAGTLTITTGTAAASVFNSIGDYHITLEAVKDGRRYSTVITVTVTL